MSNFDRFIQLLDHYSLSSASDFVYGFLHDGFKHGTFSQRDTGIDVLSRSSSLGAQASGTILGATDGASSLAFMSAGDVVYTLTGIGENKQANRKTLWAPRTVVSKPSATEIQVNAAIDITSARLFWRKLASGTAVTDGWIGAGNASFVALEVVVHSGGPVTVQKQSASDRPDAGDLTSKIVTLEESSVSASEFWKLADARVNFLRFGFKGTATISAGLHLRRGA